MESNVGIEESSRGVVQYVIPARTLSGSAEDVLAELDDMIDALRLVRTVVVERMPKRARPPHPGWLTRLCEAVGLGGHDGLSAKRYPTHGSVSR